MKDKKLERKHIFNITLSLFSLVIALTISPFAKNHSNFAFARDEVINGNGLTTALSTLKENQDETEKDRTLSQRGNYVL